MFLRYNQQTMKLPRMSRVYLGHPRPNELWLLDRVTPY